MSAFDLVVRGGLVVSESAEGVADVGIRDGRVAAIGTGLGAGTRTVDARGQLVLPGVVDPHVHVAVEGDPHMAPVIEDLVTASEGAVLGGTTTISSYIRSVPGRSMEQAITQEIARGREGASADFALNLLCTPEEDPVEAVRVGRRHGIRRFKAMMAYKNRGLMLTDDHLLRLMFAVAEAGARLLVHPENGLATEVLEVRSRARGAPDNSAFLETAPGCLEAEGMFRAATLASIAGCPLLFVHLSAAQAVAMARVIPTVLDVDVQWETQPHYVFLTNDTVLERGALAKVGPPIREAEDVTAVRDALRSGLVSHLSSDHAPRTRAMKLESDDILDAPYGGTTGSGILLRLGLSLWRAGVVPLGRMVELVATNAAKSYGLYPHKGTLAPGADADVVVVPREFDTEPLRAETIAGASDYSLYEGVPIGPAPTHVVRHGRVVVEHGELTGGVPATYLGDAPPP